MRSTFKFFQRCSTFSVALLFYITVFHFILHKKICYSYWQGLLLQIFTEEKNRNHHQKSSYNFPFYFRKQSVNLKSKSTTKTRNTQLWSISWIMHTVLYQKKKPCICCQEAQEKLEWQMDRQRFISLKYIICHTVLTKIFCSFA